MINISLGLQEWCGHYVLNWKLLCFCSTAFFNKYVANKINERDCMSRCRINLYSFHTVIFSVCVCVCCLCLEGGGCWLIHGPNQIIFVINQYIFLPLLIVFHNVFFFYGSTVLVGLGLGTVEVSKSRSDTPHSVGLLWMSDRSVAETSNWRHTANTTDRLPISPAGDERP
jgi:hypothetical protein